jgi:hypothetical protein
MEDEIWHRVIKDKYIPYTYVATWLRSTMVTQPLASHFWKNVEVFAPHHSLAELEAWKWLFDTHWTGQNSRHWKCFYTFTGDFIGVKKSKYLLFVSSEGSIMLGVYHRSMEVQ